MQGFHYNYIKNKYCDKDEMLLTNTDRLMYKIEAKLELMFLKDFTKIKSYLTSVITQKIKNITMMEIIYS